MKPIIFCGYHHAGKTTLLERAIGALALRGHRVGVVKHVSRRLDFAAKGKDLSRYMAAGAAEVHLLTGEPEGPDETGGPSAERRGLSPGGVLASTSADLLLVEGFKDYRGPVPRIVFGRNREEIEGLMDESTVGYSGFGLSERQLSELRSTGARFLPMN